MSRESGECLDDAVLIESKDSSILARDEQGGCLTFTRREDETKISPDDVMLASYRAGVHFENSCRRESSR